MMIWIGALLPENIGKLIKEKYRSRNQAIGLNEDALLLPQHISLKIIFPYEFLHDVEQTVAAYFQKVRVFFAELGEVEQHEGILWIAVRKSRILEKIHLDLDRILEETHGIVPHKYDRDFLFHTTLFRDNDMEKIRTMYELSKNDEAYQRVKIREVAIGSSESNLPGTFHVDRIISL